MTKTLIYLVRHGESKANRDEVVGGHFDAPLSDKGKSQAACLRGLLKNVHFDTAYSSDLKRAMQTAKIIYGKEVPIKHRLFDLRERNFGELEGKPVDEWNKLNKIYESKYIHLPLEKRWQYDYADFVESDKTLFTRFNKSLLKIAQSNKQKTVLVVAHGGCIRVMLMKLGLAAYYKPGSFPNAGYVAMEYADDHFIVKEIKGVDTLGKAAE